MTGRKRIFELDVLRGIAILLVMGAHVPARSNSSGIPFWSRDGWLGVELFFVLSGFLIANLLFSEYRETGRIKLRRFFVRRALKLYPSFYLMLLATVSGFLFWRVSFTARQLFGELLFSQNYVGALWRHTWSLAIEEHFYLLLPLAMSFMMARSRAQNPFRAIPFVFGALALMCLLFRVWNAATHPIYDHQVHYQPSHLRMDSLFAGVFIAYLHNFEPQLLKKTMAPPWRFPIALAGIACLIPALFLNAINPIVYTIGLTTNYIAFGVMLLLTMYKENNRRQTKPGTVARWVANAGLYSYTIYLWHTPMTAVFVAISHHFEAVPSYVFFVLYFIVSIGVGFIMSKLIERPILRFRERLFVERAEAPLVTLGLSNPGLTAEPVRTV